ncbi:MAG: NAD-dependent epimerase/dehydratase family protein, partial [Verrucomicrobia bacterium]|nr:NAD-dependent epimerase/dehydratase family protein [Verrucomicrobiota bacterium]
MLFVVTGAQGYVGTRVVRAFADRGDKVVAIDLLKAPSNRQANVTWVQSDLAAPSNLTQVVKGEDYALVHLAWDMRRGAGYAVQAANLPI